MISLLMNFKKYFMNLKLIEVEPNMCTAIEVYHAIDKGKIEVFRNNEYTATLNITTNFVNITNKQNHKTALDAKTVNEYIQKPSQPSQLSPSSYLSEQDKQSID
jgi:hypothetical protein